MYQRYGNYCNDLIRKLYLCARELYNETHDTKHNSGIGFGETEIDG